MVPTSPRPDLLSMAGAAINILHTCSWVQPEWKNSVIHSIPNVNPAFGLPPNICGSGALKDPRETGGSHIRLSLILCQPNVRNDPGPVRFPADRIDHSGPRGPTAEGD